MNLDSRYVPVTTGPAVDEVFVLLTHCNQQATMHGHKPSKGAQIDAEIAKEEAEMLAKKKEKTDSMTGKKLEESSCEQYPPA